MVTEMSGRFPKLHLDPDTVVAVGATIQAGLSGREAALDDIVLTDVCPYTLGTATRRSRGSTRLSYLPIIERNSTVPISVVRRVRTVRKNQKKILVDIYQGENRIPDNNLHLGDLTVPVPQAPEGEQKVDIRYSYDMNGLLDVDVTVVETGDTYRKTVQNNARGMGDDEIARARQRLAELKFHPREQEYNQELLARGERLYESALGEMREYIDDELDEFDAVLDRQDPMEIKKAQKELAEFLDDIERRG